MTIQHGDVVQLGRHRLMCGDATSEPDVHRLMDGEKAVLLHADPPYGMNKKGIANDNLHREKLDAFQMAWWRACRSSLADSSSVYVWGDFEGLSRLWHEHLKHAERLTLRNEVIWTKGSGQGMRSAMRRMYSPITERCLLFMLGEQRMSENADNYWEGWEPLRAYLDGERQAMGWEYRDVNRICRVSAMATHWFTRSQWLLPTRERYQRLQDAAEGAAFRREYDDLRREYDDLRPYFDNTHDLMTDVWYHAPVKGRERYGHETPKPLPLMERVCKTSAPVGGLILSPFGGTAPEMIAAEQTGRRCNVMELSPTYCQVIIDRWEALTTQRATRSEVAA